LRGFLARVDFFDARVKAFGSRLQIHGALECEDGEILGEAGAEVYYCVSGERAACTMGKNQGWQGVQGGRRVLMALNWFLDELV